MNIGMEANFHESVTTDYRYLVTDMLLDAYNAGRILLTGVEREYHNQFDADVEPTEGVDVSIDE